MTYDGIVDITNEQYHSSDGFSKSALITYRDSPLTFYKEYILKQRDNKTSDDMLLGTLVHTVMLEPSKIDKFVPRPKINKKTNKGKEEFAKFNASVEESNGIAVDIDIYQKAIKMCEVIRKNDVAIRIIASAEVEKSVYWQDSDTGLTFKSRPDIMFGSIVADLKTCKDVSYKAFQKSCMDYGYFLQASMCKLGLNAHDVDFERFVFICVDKNTYEVVVYTLDEQAIEYGINQFKSLSTKISKEIRDNSWLEPRIKVLEVPRWAEWE